MKKITSENPIDFFLRGVRHSKSEVTLHIDSKGCVVDDNDAVVVAQRLGSQVSISDIEAKDVAKEAKKVVDNLKDTPKK